MKKMKIIDLLNKIANNEEMPERLKDEDGIYLYDYWSNDYYSEDDSTFYLLRDGFGKCYSYVLLNDELEIVEGNDYD